MVDYSKCGQMLDTMGKIIGPIFDKLSDDKKSYIIQFFDYGDEGAAFTMAFNLCIKHHGHFGPEKVKWEIGGLLNPDEASDPLGRCGFIKWERK